MTLLLGLLLALGADPPCPGGTVIERADLEGGVIALHDVLRQTRLDARSLDGYDAEPVAPWGAPEPVRVVVDGAPAASTTSIEPPGLAGLPVAAAEIARVVVCPGPGLAAGRWGGPWIEIETRRPERVHLAGAYGNETGDPGPALYLDREGLVNVERWGPYGEAALSARAGRAEAWATARLQRLYPTDSLLAPRIYQVYTDGNDLPLRSGLSSALAVRAPGLQARLGLARASDFPFLPGIQREAALDRQTAQATLAGSRSAGPVRARGYVHAAHLRLDPSRGNRLSLQPDGLPASFGPTWAELRLDAAASASLSRGGRALAVGVQGESVSAEAPGLPDGRALAGRAWAHAGRSRPRGGEALTVQLTATDDGLGIGGDVTAHRSLGGRLDVRLTAALDRSPEPPGRLGSWLRRGYSGLDGTGVALAAAPRRAPRRALARLDLGLAPTPTLRLSLGADVHHARLDVERFEIVTQGTVPEGQVTIVPAEGTAAQLDATARWESARWTLSAGGRLLGPLGGDSDFRAAWRRLPRAQATARATLRPDDRVRLWAGLRAQTGAEWTGYSPPAVPASALLDLGLAKRAWGERLQISLIGRNVLDAPERTHPLGAVLDARLFLRAALSL